MIKSKKSKKKDESNINFYGLTPAQQQMVYGMYHEMVIVDSFLGAIKCFTTESKHKIIADIIRQLKRDENLEEKKKNDLHNCRKLIKK